MLTDVMKERIRMKQDKGETTRVTIIFIACISVYATIATFVLSNAA